jgi:hypothetical protein
VTTFPQQTQQPIALIYGPLPVGDTTQDLESGFDYVLSHIWGVNGNVAGAGQVLVKDESGIIIFGFDVPAAVTGSAGVFQTRCEMPVGPRTALIVNCSIADLYMYIGGYALNPPSALHI